MAVAFRGQNGLLIAVICVGVGAGSVGQSVADEKNSAAKKSLSDARTVIKRIGPAKPEQVEEHTVRLKELEADGVPVRQLLCESILSAQGGTSKKLFGVLSDISAETASDLERLTAPPPLTGSSTETFQHYGGILKELAKRNQPEAALAPLVKQILTILMKADTEALYASNAARVPSELKTRAYEDGVRVLGKMAKTDDGAYAVLVGFVDLGRAPKFTNSEEEVYQLAGLELVDAANGNGTRIRIALVSLEANLKKRFADAQQPNRGGIVGAGQNLVSQNGVTYALTRIGAFGKNARNLARLVKQVQQDPRFQQVAASTLDQISG